jgi:hypothetical protein
MNKIMDGFWNTLVCSPVQNIKDGCKNMDMDNIRIVNAQQAKDKHVFNIIKEKVYKTNTDMNKSKNIQVVFMCRRPPVNEILKGFLNNGLT